ncbi:hypothetical protein AVEN_6545-1 [Araneus ventricosus]|uniref:ATP-dependent DNA helicase n=1 Tax=Araneus ventricosus TaxID=182803 RepID=A0A4Y2AUR0_ARAVE|nr:hypothetical protein AVEN_6545-1 [Araneus ventricosus]
MPTQLRQTFAFILYFCNPTNLLELGINTRSICLSIMCETTSKQLLGFKLPVPLLDTSVSSMRSTSPEADKLRQAVLIIIDEITMLTKDGLRCIDSLLRDLMNKVKPFGGKVIIIGGDFRQTLPVVRRVTRADVIESWIKSSPLWSKFTHLSLTTNIRCAGQTEHNMLLLNIGSGNLPEISGLPGDAIEIP